MCNGDCQQGRSCDCASKSKGPLSDREAFIVAVAIGLIAASAGLLPVLLGVL